MEILKIGEEDDDEDEEYKNEEKDCDFKISEDSYLNLDDLDEIDS